MNVHGSALQREAADPSTSARRLAELAQQDPSLWEEILRNPSCDPGYREWILAQRPDLHPAAAPATTRGEMARAVAPPRTAGTRRSAVPILAALGMLTLVFALGAGGTLWWVSRAGADREPGPAAGAEDAHPTEPVESSDSTEDPEPDEETDGDTETPAEDTFPTADASTAPKTTASIETEPETTAPLETDQETTDPDEPTIDGERIESEVTRVISSPSQNIGCELGESYVGCTIRERDLDMVGCPDHPTASFEIADGSSATTVCGVRYLGEVGDSVLVLEYGESISFGGATCASESDGMTCWDDETGHSMTVSRSGVWLS